MSTPTYSPSAVTQDVDLDLSRNEGRSPAVDLVELAADSNDLVRRYPDTTILRTRLAELRDVQSNQVLVTAGGDDALLRCVLARLGPGRIAVATNPTFQMIPVYAAQVGARLVEVDWWTGPFPAAKVCTAARDADVVFVVSPNNPTGGVITESDLREVSDAAELVVLDAAYAEFAEEDLTAVALELGNVVVIRTLSKAYGLAGLRVGYLIGPPSLIAEMSSYGSPYPVSTLSAAATLKRLERIDDVADFVEEVRVERAALRDFLSDLGVHSLPSQGNFVLAETPDVAWTDAACRSLGVGLRRFPGREGLKRWVRITLPGDPADFGRLERALRTALAPQAVLFDLDGVLVDVSRSYRQSIIETAASFGVMVTGDDVEEAKAAGGSNDDWDLTQRLMAQRDTHVEYDEVVARFEEIYQGSAGTPGLKVNERPLVDGQTWKRWAQAVPLAVVTGRPRKDAEAVLERFDLLAGTSIVVAREDAPLKPHPAPVLLALEQLDVDHAWFVGDTPDDIAAARSAGVAPIGVVPAGADRRRARRALSRAARILDRTLDLEELLP